MANERKRYHTKPWEELTFADNFLFCKILEDDPELCRQLLELLLHIKIDHLEPPQGERAMQETLDAKSVRFDVYTKDDSRIFDIEMQTTDAGDLPERSRYYQSVIDMDNLSRGESYTKLKDSYIIFLCLKDVFRKGLPVYFFEYTCREDKTLTLRDRAYRVFFNAANCDKLENGEMRSFFRFLRGTKADTDFLKKIEEKLEFAKRNMAWRKQYMTWQQTIDHEKHLAFEEGVSLGIEQNARENARNLLRMNLGTLEQIAQAVSLPLAEVLSLREESFRETVQQ